jgi:hypothetical protein
VGAENRVTKNSDARTKAKAQGNYTLTRLENCIARGVAR